MARSRDLRCLALALLVGGAASSPALAQPNRNQSGRPTGVPANTGKQPDPAQPATTPPQTSHGGAGGTVAFAPTPFRLDSVGLTMRLPEGCNAQSTTVADRATTQITPRDSTWLINIQLPRTSNPEATIAEAADKTITLIQGSYGKVDPLQKEIRSTEARVLEHNDKLILPGGAAARFYISVPNNDNSRVVKGYTIFKPTAQQYVVFELICAEDVFKTARGLYETVIGTAQFADSEAVMLERGIFIKAGAKFLAALTEADYQQVMSDQRSWQRLYKPASSGAPGDATELGYRGIRFWKGRRGEIDPDKPRNQWSKAEQEEGLLCSVEGRFVVYGQSGNPTGVADSVGIYFMKPDRGEEMWSIRTIFTDDSGKQVSAATDTGARSGDSLTIIKKETGQPVTTLAPANLGEGYMSKFESFLLPRLLVKHKVQTTIGTYAWSDQERVLSFRKDEVTRDTSRGNLFTIKTSFREEAVSQTYTYNDKGDLVRGEIEGLGVWEPTDPETLMSLWKRKGLPVDKVKAGK